MAHNTHSHKGHKGLKVGLMALAAAGAATYFLTGERGVQNRKKLKQGLGKAKKELNKAVRHFKTTKGQFEKRLHALKDVAPEHFREAYDDLKEHWEDLREDLEQGT